MSKRGYISRYLLIIKKLKAKPYASYEELLGYMDDQLEYLQMGDDSLNIGFSKRTLQRDLREIRNLFGIVIEYSKSEKGYYIVQNEVENMNFQRMMEAFDIFNSLNLSHDLSPFMHLEQRKPQGTENLYGLLHAIKNRLKIHFDYHKFWDEELTKRQTSPYALKEFKDRWYVLAEDGQDGQIKSFALDRLSKLDITKEHFHYPEDFDVAKRYQNCFGIISPNEPTPQDIILSFDPFQGKYIKTLPLHHTQRVLVDNEQEMRISLRLFLTHDLVMELLSFGSNVKVLAPDSLASEIRDAHHHAAGQYQE